MSEISIQSDPISGLIIKRTIINNFKYILELFLYEPTVTEWINKGNKNLNINMSPLLFLSILDKNKRTYDKTKTIKITPKLIYEIIEFFNEVLSWYYDPKRNDLFMTNEENKLIFNHEYDKLSKVIQLSNSSEINVIKAMPFLIEDNIANKEGICLLINHVENILLLTLDELKFLINTLKNFSFTHETLLCIEMINFIKGKQEILEHQFAVNDYTVERIKTPFN